MKNGGRITSFLFELGTMRKIARMHQQTLLTQDLSDNIATHSYRVAFIGWFLAKEDGADPSKVMLMCLLHDLSEIRSGDHNWVHKKYIKVFDDEIIKEQLGSLPYDDFEKLAKEYGERKTKEAILAKDADLIDQILLLREYEWQGNKEAAIWLKGKKGHKENEQFRKLKRPVSKRLAEIIFKEDPSDWWNNIWTPKNR